MHSVFVRTSLDIADDKKNATGINVLIFFEKRQGISSVQCPKDKAPNTHVVGSRGSKLKVVFAVDPS